MIAIVDYGMGNLRSVAKGFQKVGIDTKITSSQMDIDNAHAVVLPGVGAFRECMKNLSRLSLTEAVIRSIQKGKPYLGICLGLQVLFSEAEEFGRCEGLDMLRGSVVKFQFDCFDGKIPHMGWNTIRILQRPPLLADVPDNSYFYFVHSYYVLPVHNHIIATKTDYGIDFASMIWKDNIVATQFHPEKSQELGLRLLTGFGNFARKA